MSALIETLNHWCEDCFVAASRQSAANIETVNHCGENFLSFAWPMLWQSSLLIVVVFALDYVLARKIRAAVRHALWLVVLVKLLLPPALALPTSATWWLWRPKPAPIIPVVNHYTVSFDQTPMPETFAPPPVSLVLPPPPRLSDSGWAMLASGAISAGLLLWLLFRWRRVAGNVRRIPASSDFVPVLEEACQLARLRSRMRLKLIDDKQSPAVYGLFRPVILLPRALAEKLSAKQLRAVLLHEAIHLRRGDVWVNCAQTLLQIAYWWHPLLWFANARIRRVREEAVDDAVMLALHQDADAYAPTLLEVARFAFRRPLASLGLIGILESRSALRQRVERLVDFRPPRKVGLTFLSLCGIFAFSAVALPMGQGPEQNTKPVTAQKTKHKFPWPDPNFEGNRFINLGAQFLILDEPQLHAAVPSLANNRKPTLLSPDETVAFLFQLKQDGARCFCRGWEHGILQAPLSGGYQYYRIGGSTNRFTITTALTTNWGGSFSNMLYGWDIQSPVTQPDWTPMNLTLRALMEDGGTLCQMDLSFPKTGAGSQHSEVTIPDGDALVWVTDSPSVPGKCQVILLSPTILKPSVNKMLEGGKQAYEAGNFDEAEAELNQALVVDSRNPAVQYYSALVSQALTNRSLFDPVIGTKIFDAPPSSSVSPHDLEQRSFAVDYADFISRMREETGETNAITGFEEILANHGVDLSPPKAIFLDGMNVLWVYATTNDLDAIGKIVTELRCPPPMLHIKARIIEVPKAFFAKQPLPAGVTNGGILTATEAKQFLRQLESQNDVQELAEPEVVTISGRQTEMRATIIQPVITNYTFDAKSTNPLVPQVALVETGPILDVVPMILWGDHKIYLQTIASQIDFFGYADARGLPGRFATNAAGEKIALPVTLPAFQVSSSSMHKSLYDGQTLVLFPKRENVSPCSSTGTPERDARIAQFIQKAEKKHGNKVLMALVTATLIDTNGHRLHSDNEMPIAQTAFLPQSPYTGIIP